MYVYIYIYIYALVILFHYALIITPRTAHKALSLKREALRGDRVARIGI